MTMSWFMLGILTAAAGIGAIEFAVLVPELVPGGASIRAATMALVGGLTRAVLSV
jgi:hypothetical protein